MKAVCTLVLLALAPQVQADVSREVSSGEIRFTGSAADASITQRSIKLGSKLVVTFNLTVVSYKEGYERIAAPSEAKNNTSTVLHYVAYLALLDGKQNVIATVGSEDVFSGGVRGNSSYEFGTTAILPKGAYGEIRSYRAVLYTSEQHMQPPR
jgi:hypothetical protein